MRVLLQNYLDQEDGAVTVEWVVLTAAVVGLALAMVGLLNTTSVTMLDRLGASVIALLFP